MGHRTFAVAAVTAFVVLVSIPAAGQDTLRTTVG